MDVFQVGDRERCLAEPERFAVASQTGALDIVVLIGRVPYCAIASRSQINRHRTEQVIVGTSSWPVPINAAIMPSSAVRNPTRNANSRKG
jgi:hypothetical protein